MMDELKVFGTPYFKELFIRPKVVEKLEYSSHRIPIGTTIQGGIFYIDLKEATRISMIASSGGGKSWLMRGFMDRLNYIGHAPVMMTDIKGEMVSSLKPLQSKFHKLLLKGETPRPMKIVELRPTFFMSINRTLPKNNVWYSVDMKRMTAREFMTFMNAKDLTPTQRIVLELIYQELTKEFKNNPVAKFSLEFIEKVIDNIDDIDSRSNMSMKLKFRPLKESNFYYAEHEKSIIAGINRGYVPSINLTDFESFGRESFNYPVVTLSIVLREIIRGRRDKDVAPLMIFIDEATRFCGNDKENSFKHEFLEAIDVERRFGTSFCTAWQSMTDIPEKVLNQSRYVFVSGTENVNTLKNILNNTGIARSPQSAPSMATRLKMRMKGRPYSWIVFDRKLQTMEIIAPVAPLSHHMEGSM